MAISALCRGELLRQGRIQSCLTLEQVAEMFDVNRSTVMRWENGSVEHISVPVLKELARIYKIPVLDLFEGKRDRETLTVGIARPESNVRRLVTPEEQVLLTLFRQADKEAKEKIIDFMKAQIAQPHF